MLFPPPFHFRCWDDICQPKENGGLGIRNLFHINRSLITRAAWNISTDKDPFLTSVLKAKYYLIFPSGLLKMSHPNLSSGLLSFRLSMISLKTALFKFTEVTQTYGLPLGVRFGIPFTIT